MSVKIVAITVPRIEGISTAEEFIAYAARVSNPGNQINNESAPKLLKYLAKHKHWSPFEMVDVVMEIVTTRDIGRQILRHRSFSFQEFSQRYAEVANEPVFREARLQDQKNRQNSIKIDDESKLHLAWRAMQNDAAEICRAHYTNALQMGIAKEQARAVLPEGLTSSTMYMKGSLRSWIHYCDLRMAHGTQLEHQEIAYKAWSLILKEFPSLSEVLDGN
jgi:thymidylate synthase (FAD)